MNNQKISKDIIVIYHGECPDGFSAAWVAWKKLEDNADYIPAHYQESLPDSLVDKEIYILDFSFPKDLMAKIVKDNKKVIVIDHHITGKAISEMASDCLFDVGHSGAVLTWHYFHPQKPLPRLLRYVEDMDLWKFELPHTKEIIAYLDSIDFSFSNWDEVVKLAEKQEGFDKIVEKGSVILKYQESVIKAIIEDNAEEVEFESHQALAVNSPIFNSQIGNKLTEKVDIGIVWVQSKKGIKYSLRSRGEINVAELTIRFPNGGGHKNAAGFVLPPDSDHPWKKLK